VPGEKGLKGDSIAVISLIIFVVVAIYTTRYQIFLDKFFFPALSYKFVCLIGKKSTFS
jgi:hypothetical protein